MSENITQNSDGSWSEATPLKYYPSKLEKLLHMFGVHQWSYVKPKKCVMCGKLKTKESK